ncbi:MAG: M28 family metallopeptidase [Nocardioides sp.]|nr:M28 family metallopeptidase [Nocardioides sp.]
MRSSSTRATSLRAGLAGLASISVLAVATATAAGPAVATPADHATSEVAAPDINVDDVVAHLEELQSIADANGGNRNTGEPGYQASVDYVQTKLDAAGYETRIQEFETAQGTSYNLIADLPGGDEASTVMLGGHLDSVGAGPGINDNGTGSAALIEIAETYAAQNPDGAQHVRFAFWGAEELGLLGSTHYVESLSSDEASQISAYANFDMLGSPNPGYFVYDDDPSATDLRDDLTELYTAAGTESAYVDVDGRSDHAAFMQAGIPTAGTFSGAEELKTKAEAEMWGGEAGAAYDPCYHSACDTMDNLDTEALDVNADVIAAALWQWTAGSTKSQ